MALVGQVVGGKGQLQPKAYARLAAHRVQVDAAEREWICVHEMWVVLRSPAKAARPDDLLGREVGPEVGEAGKHQAACRGARASGKRGVSGGCGMTHRPLHHTGSAAPQSKQLADHRCNPPLESRSPSDGLKDGWMRAAAGVSAGGS